MTSAFCSDCVVKAAKVFRYFWASYLVLSSFGCHFSYISNFTSDFSVCTETAITGGGFKNHKRNCNNNWRQSTYTTHFRKRIEVHRLWKDIYTTRTNKNKDRKYKIIGRTRTARTGIRGYGDEANDRTRTSIPSFVADGILVQRQLLEVLEKFCECRLCKPPKKKTFFICTSFHTLPQFSVKSLNRLSNLKCDSLHTAHCTSFSYLGMWVVGWFRWHSEQNRYALKVLRQWWITAPQQSDAWSALVFALDSRMCVVCRPKK